MPQIHGAARRLCVVVAVVGLAGSGCGATQPSAAPSGTASSRTAATTSPSTDASGLPPFRDVTMYRADEARTGVQPGPGPVSDPTLVWSRKSQAPIRFSPVLLSGILIVGSNDGLVYGLDARTGADRWAYAAGAAVEGSGAAANGTVVVADGDGRLHALDAATGKRRWTIDVGAQQASTVPAPLVIDNGVVYAAVEHAVRGYDLATGVEAWEWPAPDAVTTLTVFDGTAYVGASDGYLYAISLAGATERWRHKTGFLPGNTIVSGDTAFSISAHDEGQSVGNLFALDRATGTERWHFSGDSGLQISAGAVRDGVFYAPSQADGFFAVSVADGHKLWNLQGTGSMFSAAALVDDALYVAVNEPQAILAIRASDGMRLWQKPLDGTPWGGVAVSGGMVFSTDDSGEIRAYAEANVAASVTGGVSGPLAPPVSAVPKPPNPFKLVSSVEASLLGIPDVRGFGVGSDGNLVIADSRPHVSVLSPTGKLLESWGKAGSGKGDLGSPGGIAVGPTGLVYVSDPDNGRVDIFKPDGTFVRQFGRFGSAEGQFLNAFDLGVDAAANVYVADDGTGTLSKFDALGHFVWRVGGEGATDPDLQGHFHSVKIDTAGRIWVTNDGPARVMAFDTDGHKVDAFGVKGTEIGQLWAPCGVAVDRLGNLFVYQCGGRGTQVFDPVPGHRLIGGWYPDDGPLIDEGFDIASNGHLFSAAREGDHRILEFQVTLATP
jgi:outer membrane protein assembly factor BamB